MYVAYINIAVLILVFHRNQFRDSTHYWKLELVRFLDQCRESVQTFSG